MTSRLDRAAAPTGGLRARLRGAALAAGLAVSAACPAAPAGSPFGPDARRRIVAFLETLEVPARTPPPTWYRPDREPVFTFVVLSDIHLREPRETTVPAPVRDPGREGRGCGNSGNVVLRGPPSPSSEPILLEALRFIRERVRPAFVAITGDSAGGSAPARQRRLRALLAAHLPSPAFLVRGDNWARNFAAVFGSTHWSFDCGGIHFIGNGLDRDVEGLGIGVFDPASLRWLREEIDSHRDRPVVYFQHETIQPPLFLDAPKLQALFEASPNVLLVMAGHIHHDLESRLDRVLHITCPGLGPHPRHGFKIARVYPEGILIRTAERGPEGYRLAERYQGVEIPPRLRGGIRGPARIERFRALPARETIFDPALRAREGELIPPFVVYARRIGKLEALVRALLGAPARARGGGR